ncbi:MAG: hypothetical protein ACK5D7_16090, partial [Planctomycetota bacterium]
MVGRSQVECPPSGLLCRWRSGNRLRERSISGSWRGALTGLGLWALGWWLGSLPAVSVLAQESDVPTMSEAEAVEFYQTRVLPVLEKNCF